MKLFSLLIFGLCLLFSCNYSSEKNSISQKLEAELFYPIDSLENQEVKNKLRKICSTIETQNWNEFISLCDSTNYSAQIEDLGMNDEQYIYEIFNLKLEPKGNYEEHHYQTLLSIFEVNFIDYSQSTNPNTISFRFRGNIVTYKKQKIPFSIQLQKDNDNDFKIVGGWG
ncbi:hypothetical protein Fleli_2419 [Bernardetia litoralis DSM 6794]|uniref:Lipoprotein n=1 Tax=Bernardetia litoralis (strain ATCC 23117 / DSM 6794 / NBRC 15988 / NCIMB 1366 / Fx l1 / Sio-4) TaxID=880071 RepID=I4ALF1_BERLS|nr:hypothetical protein [Bernardetia litoralis]AFM04786.1 hypothetical protein Fleli_2419 [Bernardetia litoralis DSM 6794]